MSGRSVSICGSRRGFMLTDGSTVAQVSQVVTDSPKKMARRLGDREVDIINRSPHLVRADAAGSGVILVLMLLHGVEQAILVERRGATRRMTCVPLRFDPELYSLTTVFSGSLVTCTDKPTLVLEDVLRIGDGVVAMAGAEQRAHVLFDIVHNQFVADPILQPFAVECSLYMVPDASACRDVWKRYPYPVRSVIFCPVAPQYPDVYHVLLEPTRKQPTREPVRPATSKDGVVIVVPGDAPDVYSVNGSTLVVKTMVDSHKLAEKAKRGGGSPFKVQAKFDKNTGKWVFLNDLA